MTSKDANLKEIRDAVINADDDHCHSISPYIHSFWKDFRKKLECLCVENRVSIANVLKNSIMESLHATNLTSWGRISI